VLHHTKSAYKPEIAAAVFHYSAHIEKNDCLQVCIQTTQMKDAAWKYAHHKQLILNGSFGICNSKILLFICMGVDEENKGVPLSFFLFSAPTGNRATQAGYDMSALKILLEKWQNSLGTQDGQMFTPYIAITDTDTKERGALFAVWPSIWLLLCRFHVHQCWSNRRKAVLRTGQNPIFPKALSTSSSLHFGGIVSISLLIP